MPEEVCSQRRGPCSEARLDTTSFAPFCREGIRTKCVLTKGHWGIRKRNAINKLDPKQNQTFNW